MPDLKDQIRTYYEATTEPVDIDAITIDPGTVLVGPFPDAAQRRNAMQTITPETPPTSRLWRGMAAAAAAVLIVVVVGVALVVASRGGEVEPAAPPTTDAITVDEAVEVANAFYDAQHEADDATLGNLFAPDATGAPYFLSETLEGTELATWFAALSAWNIAQGATKSPIHCTGTPRPDGAVLVRCSFGESDALHHAVGAQEVPLTENMVIGAEGISSYARYWGDPAPQLVERPFERWMNAHHPEDVRAAGFGNWTSVEEAGRFGKLRADYAQQWAEHLAANGCTYSDFAC